MREACILQLIKPSIAKAAFAQQECLALDEAWAAHIQAGGTEDDWQAESDFDKTEAEELGTDLVARSTGSDLAELAQAYDEIAELGLKTVELMSEAHSGTLGEDDSSDKSVKYHDARIRELERRLREVKRDYDQLQQSRPDEGTFIKG